MPGRLEVLTATVLWLSAAGCAREREPAAVSARPLTPATPVEARLEAGGVHAYAVALEAGQFLEVHVEQEGADVLLALLDPAGRELVTVDGLNGDRGPEVLYAIARKGGEHRLEVRPWSPGTRGGYRLESSSPRPAGDRDRLRAAAAETLMLAMREADSQDLASRRRATARYEHARERWRRGQEPAALALTVALQGQLLAGLGESGKAAEHFEEALGLFQALGRREELPGLLNDLGNAYDELQQRARARDAFEEARERAVELGNRREEAMALENLAVLLAEDGQSWQALDLHEQALPVFEELADEETVLAVLHNIGSLLLWLGERQQAKPVLDRALDLARRRGDRRREAAALAALGRLALEEAEPESAREILTRVQELRRDLGDRRGQGMTCLELGKVELERGDPEAAIGEFLASLTLLGESGQLHDAAYGLHGLGNALERLAGDEGSLDRARSALSRVGGEAFAAVAEATEQGALAAALAAHRLAEELFLYTPERAEALRGQARVLFRQDDLEAARSRLEQALPLVEALREATWGGDLGASYFASVQVYYEDLVAVLMELDRRRPGEGYAERAATVAERRRARSLLDQLGQAREVGSVGEPLRQELRALRRKIREREGERLRLETAGAPAEQVATVAAEVGQLLLRLDRLEAKTRRVAGAEPAMAEPLTVEEIQSQVVDEETALLLYSLGEERSWVWLIRPGEVVPAELPAGRDLDAAARRLHRQLGESRDEETAEQAERTAAALSGAVLGRLAGRLNTRRLLVVADGALQLVPFGILPHPDGGGTVLDHHEVVHLPSASVLARLRRAVAEREPAPALVAALADPVFDAADPRVQNRVAAAATAGGLLGRGSGAELERSASELGLADLPRLPATRREVEALLALAPPGQETWSALDFAAGRQAVVGGHLSRFRILHFATHALLHAEHPELSGVVLSGVDERGAPVDGFLRAFEIAALRLPAELVVLSACRTALGPEVRGEGLVGLPQSFLAAGAARVVVSLWNASDAATAELMVLFYRGLFDGGLPPAAALRQAQLAMRRHPRWSAPYYWAGFVLVGEGR